MTTNAEARLRAALEKRKAAVRAHANAPLMQKAVSFLQAFVQGQPDFLSIEYEIGHRGSELSFAPVQAGHDGLTFLLEESGLSDEALGDLLHDAAGRPDLTPQQARPFILRLLDLMERNAPISAEPEGAAAGFAPDDIYRFRTADGGIERLRCIDMIGFEGQAYALLVPYDAADEDGPYTAFRYFAVHGEPFRYERVDDPDLTARIASYSFAHP